jgi:predicted flap endonuclease-1-like 5' DNA nuclease
VDGSSRGHDEKERARRQHRVASNDHGADRERSRAGGGAPRPKKEAKPKAEKPKKEKATPAPKKEGTPLEEIAGVGPKTAERLREAGYSSAEDIAKADVDALAEIKGISKKSATELIDNAKGL